jgi:hypothetical protein
LNWQNLFVKKNFCRLAHGAGMSIEELKQDTSLTIPANAWAEFGIDGLDGQRQIERNQVLATSSDLNQIPENRTDRAAIMRGALATLHEWSG